MSKKLIIPVIVSIWLATSPLAAFSSSDSGIDVKAIVDRKSIYIGDRIRFTLSIGADKGTTVEIPEYRGHKIGDFEIKDTDQKMGSTLFGKRLFTKRYILTTYTTGSISIPEIEIKYKIQGAQEWESVRTNAIQINVISLLPKESEPEDIRDIKGPLSIRNPYWGIIALFVALTIFIFAGLILYNHIKRYTPVKLPHETALEELEIIRAAYLQGGDVKIYYVEVSDCVRRYIEHRYNLRAPEMTTEEFLDSLRDSDDLSIDNKSLLRGFLNACDMVKFAKYDPSQTEAEAVYDTAKKFIEQTREVTKNVRV